MHECKFCARTFAGKRAHSNHQKDCAKLHGVEEEEEEEQVKDGNVEELWKIVYKLQKDSTNQKKEIEKLTKKFDKLSKHASNQIKNIKITDWLNKNHRGIITFEQWKESWEVTNEQMEYLLEKKFVNGVINIFKENMGENAPLRSFKKSNRNDIYIYSRDDLWKKMSDKDFRSLIANTQCKIAGAVKRWVLLNPKIVNNNTDGKYERAMIEAFGGSREKSLVDRDIRKKLFEVSKMELKNIQTYEFS
jgi:hypothetical protein